jgi:uncharacterized membrane protein YkgB
MVVIFVSFGMQKFTLQSAQGIVQFISNSPFISWLSIFGFRGEAYFLGVVEFVIAALLAAGAFSPILSAAGSLMGVITFAITWSFFFTTPGVSGVCRLTRWSGTWPASSYSRTLSCSASALCCSWLPYPNPSSGYVNHDVWVNRPLRA